MTLIYIMHEYLRPMPLGGYHVQHVLSASARNDERCRSLLHQPHKPTIIRPWKRRQVLVVSDLGLYAFKLLESSLAVDGIWESGAEERRVSQGYAVRP